MKDSDHNIALFAAVICERANLSINLNIIVAKFGLSDNNIVFCFVVFDMGDRVLAKHRPFVGSGWRSDRGFWKWLTDATGDVHPALRRMSGPSLATKEMLRPY